MPVYSSIAMTSLTILSCILYTCWCISLGGHQDYPLTFFREREQRGALPSFNNFFRVSRRGQRELGIVEKKEIPSWREEKEKVKGEDVSQYFRIVRRIRAQHGRIDNSEDP